jgi:hypothetical protein
MDFEFGEPEFFKMRHPGVKAGEDAGFMSGQQLDELVRQVALAHESERRIVDLISFIASAQQLQKVQPAL